MLSKNSVLYRFLCISWVIFTLVPRNSSLAPVKAHGQFSRLSRGEKHRLLTCLDYRVHLFARTCCELRMIPRVIYTHVYKELGSLRCPDTTMNTPYAGQDLDHLQ